MTTISLSIPDSLHHGITELAAKDGYTMDQFLICAAAEKLSAFATEDYLKMRTGRADLEAFDRVMSRVPDVPPDAGDELP